MGEVVRILDVDVCGPSTTADERALAALRGVFDKQLLKLNREESLVEDWL